MMKRFLHKIFIVFISVILFTSCELIDNLGGNTIDELSNSEIVEGLKKALNIGTDSSTNSLSNTNGYYLDRLVKIPLPPETNVIYSNLSALEAYDITGQVVPLIEDQLENLVLSINRSAEDAAKQAAPIFTEAITNLTVVDGWDILHGTVPNDSLKSETLFDSLAATKYLKNQTYLQLVDLYSPYLNSSLSKPFVLNKSAFEIWESITSNYNQIVSVANQASLITGKTYNAINTDIGEFVTQKALDGLFFKVGEEEKKIRNNPYDWVDNIIQKVFGSVYKE